VTIEPVPTPFPVAELGQEPTLRHIVTTLPPGGLIRLPYYDQGTSRFCRHHFYEQLMHGRPIVDQVAGFPSTYMLQNHLLTALLIAEHSDGFKTLIDQYPANAQPVSGTPEERAKARQQLVADGFVAIILEPGSYSNDNAREEAHTFLREFGEPEESGKFEVWRLK
jgi:hypothetical protein